MVYAVCIADPMVGKSRNERDRQMKSDPNDPMHLYRHMETIAAEWHRITEQQRNEWCEAMIERSDDALVNAYDLAKEIIAHPALYAACRKLVDIEGESACCYCGHEKRTHESGCPVGLAIAALELAEGKP